MTDENEQSSEHYKLQLFITGSTPRSTRAIQNLRTICEQSLKGRYELEVIDVYQNPEATQELQIVATPTLVKLLPEPLRRVIRPTRPEPPKLSLPWVPWMWGRAPALPKANASR